MNKNYSALLSTEQVRNVSYEAAKKIAEEKKSLEISAQDLIARIALCFLSKGTVEHLINNEKELTGEIFSAFKKSGVISILAHKSGVRRMMELKESFYQASLKITNEAEKEEYESTLQNAILFKLSDAPVIVNLSVPYEREIVKGSGVFERKSYVLRLQKIDILDSNGIVVEELKFLKKLTKLEGADNVALKNKLDNIIKIAKVIIAG